MGTGYLACLAGTILPAHSSESTACFVAVVLLMLVTSLTRVVFPHRFGLMLTVSGEESISTQSFSAAASFVLVTSLARVVLPDGFRAICEQ